MREILKGAGRSTEAREFCAGRDKRKKGGRVFSLEDRVGLRLSMEKREKVCLCMFAFVYLYVCICVPVVCRNTKGRKNIF